MIQELSQTLSFFFSVHVREVGQLSDGFQKTFAKVLQVKKVKQVLDIKGIVPDQCLMLLFVYSNKVLEPSWCK